jgi:uncharacterized protein YqgC (DUF456 family)
MEPWAEVSSFGITLLFMLIGLIGLIVPIFPGILIIWLSALGYGVVTGFSTLGIILFVLITLLMIAGEVIDNVLMGAGARKGGASWLSIVVGILAGVIGTLLFPPVGGFIAAPAAILLLEYSRGRDWEKAWRATRGLAIGWGLGFLVRFGVGVLMIGMWLVWALSRN